MAIKVTGMTEGIIRSSDKAVMVNTGSGYQTAAELGIDPSSVFVPTRLGVDKVRQVLSDRGYISIDTTVGDAVGGVFAATATANGVTATDPTTGRARKIRTTKRRPKLAVFGDSLGAYNNQVTSVLVNKMSRGPLVWAAYKTHNQMFEFEPASNFGVAGDTTAMMVARLPALVAYIIANAIDRVYVVDGTNDVNALLDFDTITKPNMKLIYDTLLDLGVVVEMQITPARSFNMTADKQLLLFKQVRYQYDYAGSHDNVLLIDNTPGWIDAATGLPTAANAPDGLHWGSIGAEQAGDAYLAVVTPTYAPAVRQPFNPLDIYDAVKNPGGNLLVNGQFAGSTAIAGSGATAGCAGTIPPNMAPSRVSGTSTATFTAQARTDGIEGSEIMIAVNTASGATATESWRITQVINAGATTFQPGDQLYCEVEMERSGMSGNWYEHALRPVHNDGVTGVTIQDMATPGDQMPNKDTKGTLRVPVYLVPNYAGSGTQRYEFRFQISGNASVSNLVGTYKLRTGKVCKVLPNT